LFKETKFWDNLVIGVSGYAIIFDSYSFSDTIEDFNVESKAEYSALSSTRSQKKKPKQTTPVPL